MDLKERVMSLVNLMAELEEKKKAVLHEIAENIEYSEQEEITPDFIEWYYWETELSTVPLANALKISTSQVNGYVTPKTNAVIPCMLCKEPITFEAKTRNEYSKIKKQHRDSLGKLKYWKKLDNNFICPTCQRAKKKQEQERKIKNNISAAKSRVTRDGKGLDLEKMPYQEYLQTTYWKKFAHKARKKADYCCQKCGRGNTLLDVHHLTYERRGKEWYSDVLVLCRQCHNAIHGKAANN